MSFTSQVLHSTTFLDANKVKISKKIFCY